VRWRAKLESPHSSILLFSKTLNHPLTLTIFQMCGIAAIFSPQPANLAAMMRSMLQTVRHRGPDDEGIALFSSDRMTPSIYGGPDTPAHCYSSNLAYAPREPLPEATEFHPLIALGHRRLAIVDVTATGHQPMCTRDGNCWITYNGEIYNHPELRAELERLGHRFVSRSDTEVILAAYQQWGMHCLERFNGMFAFVLLDKTRRALLLVRDRFGIKPLYYWQSPIGFLAVGSEIKQFTGLPGWRSELNGQRAYDYLNWGLLDHTGETLFKNVRQLRQGEFLTLDVGALLTGIPPAARWNDISPRPFAGSLEDAADEVRRLLEDSVRLRLRADVPVGSCLSGGLDSSSIVCKMDGLLSAGGVRGQQKTFSARSHAPQFDEGKYIDEVVRHTNVESHEVYPEADQLLDTIDALTWTQDEPFGSTSIYAQWLVFGLAAGEGVKVVLDGQGADELFAGYHNYFGARFAGLFRQGSWSELESEMRRACATHGYSWAWVLQQLLNNILPEALRQPLRRLGGHASTGQTWFDLERLGAASRDPYLELGSAKSGSIRDMSLAQLNGASLQTLLHWEDRDSMAHSVEARLPFLDHRLVEFVVGLPDEHKIKAGVTKLVLRDAMRGVLPEAVRARTDKLGFATAEEHWMTREFPDRFRALIEAAIDTSQGIILPGARKMFQDTVSGNRAFSFLPWRMISFGTWMRVFRVAA
jgi:asparagine synthase (glutamine-hydrolysing)